MPPLSVLCEIVSFIHEAPDNLVHPLGCVNWAILSFQGAGILYANYHLRYQKISTLRCFQFRWIYVVGRILNKRGVIVRYAWVIIIPLRRSSDPLPFCTFYSIACYKHGKKGTLMHTVTPHEMSQTDLFNRLRQRFLIKRNTLTVACEAMTDSETKIWRIYQNC